MVPGGIGVPSDRVHSHAVRRIIGCCRCHSFLSNAASRPTLPCLPPTSQASTGDSFDDRFPKTAVPDRFPTAEESFRQTSADALLNRAAQQEPASYRVASLAPTTAVSASAGREDQTMLVGLKSSAFPYLGINPRTDEPFLNVLKGARRGHRGINGKVFWQDETFNDNRVLMHVPEGFNVHQPGVIVVFFHGNGATLDRDVRERQRVPQQISESGVNAVLLAPQLAVDAAIPAPANSGSRGGSSASWPNQPIIWPNSMAIPALPRHSPHTGRHRRLQRRLHAGGLEPRGRRPRQPRARRVPA